MPITEIALAPSPNGDSSGPYRIYCTAGPGSDPVRGLNPFRTPWIETRGDTETYGGRGRNLPHRNFRPAGYWGLPDGETAAGRIQEALAGWLLLTSLMNERMTRSPSGESWGRCPPAAVRCRAPVSRR